MTYAPHFPREEMIHSETANRHGIHNLPDNAQEAELIVTSWKAEAAREILGVRLRVNSGFRCKELDMIFRPSKTSTGAHSWGGAVDLLPLGGMSLKTAFNLLTTHPTFMTDVDQLILEGGCIHIGRARPGQEARHELRGDATVDGIRRYPLIAIWEPGHGAYV